MASTIANSCEETGSIFHFDRYLILHRWLILALLLLLMNVSFASMSFAQGFGGALGKLGKDISDAGKKAGGDISREMKNAGKDLSRETKKTGSDISREGKKAINDAGKLLEKPFRHASDNAKEAIFFGMRNHVIQKNNDLGVRGVRFSKGDKYYDFIQPHLPAGMDFSDIVFFFSAYVPSDMAGITFDKYVYINEPFRPFDPSCLELLAHETGHVIQYSRWGIKGFARRYIDDAFGSWMKSPSFDQVKIHDDIEIEREASDFELEVMRSFYSKMDERNRISRQSENGFNNNQASIESLIQPNNLPAGQFDSNVDNQQISSGNQVADLFIREIDRAIQNQQRRDQQLLARPNLTIGDNSQPRLGIRFELIPGRGGIVTSVSPGMPASNAGIEIGDIIVSVDGNFIRMDDDILSALRNASLSGRRTASVVVENQRLQHLPINQRLQAINVFW